MSREYPTTPIVAVSGVVFQQLESDSEINRAEKKVLLIRRAYPPAQGKWSFPGGVVQLGETIDQAVQRELLEECGIHVKVGPLLDAVTRIIHDRDGRIQFHYIILSYVCFDNLEKVKSGSDADEVRWVDHKEIENMDLLEGVREIISKANQRSSN